MSSPEEIGPGYAEGEEFLWGSVTPKALPEMTRADVEEKLENTDIAIVPTGSIENHGPHCPLGEDMFKGMNWAKGAARKLDERGIDVLVGPTIKFGRSPLHDEFTGTISLSVETHLNLVREVVGSLLDDGFDKVVILECHSGNNNTDEGAARDLANEYPDKEVVRFDMVFPEFDAYKDNDWTKSEYYESHAGEVDTSRMLHVVPELVQLERAEPAEADDGGQWWEEQVYKYNRDYMSMSGEEWKERLPDGFEGDPTVSAAETGEKIFEWSTDFVADYIEDHLVE